MTNSELLAGLERLIHEKPRFWTDDEIIEAAKDGCSVMSRQVASATFDEIEVTSQILDSLIDDEGECDGRHRVVEISGGGFSGPFAHEKNNHSAKTLRALAEYLMSRAIWIEESEGNH